MTEVLDEGIPNFIVDLWLAISVLNIILETHLLDRLLTEGVYTRIYNF